MRANLAALSSVLWSLIDPCCREGQERDTLGIWITPSAAEPWEQLAERRQSQLCPGVRARESPWSIVGWEGGGEKFG